VPIFNLLEIKIIAFFIAGGLSRMGQEEEGVVHIRTNVGSTIPGTRFTTIWYQEKGTQCSFIKSLYSVINISK
jgi:hypothetical protein